MTTAENGQRALEFLGLVDGQQHNHIGGVSKLLYCKSIKSQSLQSFFTEYVIQSLPALVGAGLQGELDHYRLLHAWNYWVRFTQESQGDRILAL